MCTVAVAEPPVLEAVTVWLFPGKYTTSGRPEIWHVTMLSTRPAGSAGVTTQLVGVDIGPFDSWLLMEANVQWVSANWLNAADP
jgi:hypothetical protein